MNWNAIGVWILGLGLVGSASCGGTVVVGEREEDSGHPGWTGGAGGSNLVDSGSDWDASISSGSGGGWDASELGDSGIGGSGGTGGVSSWSISPNAKSDSGGGGSPFTNIGVESLATSPAGDVVVTGQILASSADNLPCFPFSDQEDGFVLSFATSGSLDLCYPVRSPGTDMVNDVAIGADGEMTLVGRIGGETPIGGFVLPNNGEDDVVVAQLSSSGEALWARSLGYEGMQEARAVALDANQDVYVVGEFEGTILSGADVLIGVGSRSAFAFKLDEQGSWAWGRSWGVGWAVAVDVEAAPSGGAVITGMFDGPIEFGDSTFVGQGARDVFLLRVDTAGNVLWSSTFGNALEQWPTNMAVDTAGNIAVVGRSSGPVDFGGGLADAGNDVVFVAVYDGDGTYRWSQQLPVGDDAELIESKPSVVFNASGDVIVAGGFRGQVDFGQGVLQSKGDADVFIAAWTGTGSSLWSHRYGDYEEQAARALSYREGVGLTVSGVFRGTIDFGSGVLESSPYGASTFLVRFP